MSRALTIAILLGGCGRLSFDAQGTSDGATGDVARDTGTGCTGAVGHDEDGDGVDDACDVCPHLADNQSDADGDRVGDACDPEPANPRQKIVFFDPFVSLAGWTAVTNESIDNDAALLRASTGIRAVHRPYVPQTDYFEMGVETLATGPGTQSLVMINLDTGAAGNYYCEMFDNGTPLLQFTYTFDGVNFLHPQTTNAPTRLVPTSARLQMARDATNVRCGAVWAGQQLAASGATPALAANELVIYAENIDVRIRYMVQIRTL